MPTETAERAEPTPRLGVEAIILLLGFNVWASLVLMPALSLGSFARVKWFVLTFPFPLVPLVIGALRRAPAWLLLGFPVSLLAPLAADPRLVGDRVHSLPSFALLSVGMLAYLGAAALLTQGAPPLPPQLLELRKLPTGGPAVRWRRRKRLYWALFGLFALFPVVLVYAVDFRPETRGFLTQMYKERAAPMRALMGMGVVILGALLWRSAFFGPLARHRTGDAQLLSRLERLRRHARRGTPRWSFYAAVLCALAFMGALLALRYHR